MTDYITVSFTCGSIEEARHIGRLLVAERLVACCQIIPWIESNYIWNERVHTAQESLVTCKTRLDCYEKVKARILDEHHYEIPEIIVQEIIEGNEEYLRWIDASLSSPQSESLPLTH